MGNCYEYAWVVLLIRAKNRYSTRCLPAFQVLALLDLTRREEKDHSYQQEVSLGPGSYLLLLLCFFRSGKSVQRIATAQNLWWKLTKSLRVGYSDFSQD